MHHEANKHNKKDRGRTKRSSLGRLRDGAEQDGEMSNTQICGGLLRSTHPLWPLSYPASLHLWSWAWSEHPHGGTTFPPVVES